MSHPTAKTPEPANQDTPGKGLKVWQLALTIVAVALTLRVALGALPAPDTQSSNHAADLKPVAERRDPIKPVQAADAANADLSIVKVLPFNLKGEVPGPLLTSILQRYLPHSTPDHADALRDTLPPGQDPRMIVIIPDEEDVEAMF